MMSFRLKILVVFCCINQLSSAQTIDRVEYFFNTDPGPGNGTNVTITSAPDVADLSIAANISALNYGFNTLYTRSHSSNNNWSITKQKTFLKQLIAASNISKLEYFVDTDPGFGLGINVSISPSPDISNIAIPVDLSGYSTGFHTLYVRSMDDNSKWSINNRWVFIKQPAAGSNIIKLEYFIDTDPGIGSATDVAITASANVSDVAIPVDITTLGYGFHNLFVRSKDDAGKWSIANQWVFVKDKIQNALIMGEYFFDTDPGFGNGTPIPALPQTPNINDFVFAADVTALSNAPHILFIRSLDDWSITNAIAFTKSVIVPVNLLNFRAKAVKTNSLLTWQTATEANNERFEIEQSRDALHFIKIGSVKGVGNSNILQSYSFTDYTPAKGINFYRLKQVDTDGKFVYSETRRVDFNDSPLFELYNNPSNGTNIIVKTNLKGTVLNIYDISGRKLQQVALTGYIYELPVNNYTNGTYLSVLTQNGKLIAAEKFVIRK